MPITIVTLHAITIFLLDKPRPDNVLFDISEVNEINWGATDHRKDAHSFKIFRNPGPVPKLKTSVLDKFWLSKWRISLYVYSQNGEFCA